MAVYVDDARLPFGQMIMCHMWADSDEELLAMADRIGLNRRWIQGHPTLSVGKGRNASWVHFDVSVSKKDLAIKAGAILTDRYAALEHAARLDLASDNPWRRKRGAKRMGLVMMGRAPTPAADGDVPEQEPRP